MKFLMTLAAAAAVWAAVGAETIFKGGLWKEFVYDKPSKLPVVFGGASRSVDACARDYCIYLDMWYDDGTPEWGVRAEWSAGTHDWEMTAGAFVPGKPIRKIQMFVFLRHGTGKAEFKDLWLERREGNCDVLGTKRMTGRPFVDAEQLSLKLFVGRSIVKKTVDLPGTSKPLPALAPSAAPWRVWTADSMRKITPLTFPSQQDLAATSIDLEVARAERESAQINISTDAETEWSAASLVLPKLAAADGTPLKGALTWQRVGYVAREPGYYAHPMGVPDVEKWLPDPLLPAAPMRVRKGSTQGAWLTVCPDRDAKPGVYTGDVVVTEKGAEHARVRLTVRVRSFAQPTTFGMPTAFCVMDGFTRAQYGARYEEMRRQSWDVMLDHRLNPDDISRTSPPPIPDLLRARDRGMNRFNILNIVPPPKSSNELWVCYTPPEATFNPHFYPAFKARLAPYVAELRKHGLEKFAYLYGFDERREEYYEGIDRLWKQIKADFPDIPVMTTAMMYTDMVQGKTNSAYTITTDWYCPLTSAYRTELSEKLRAMGKQIWWYTCCGPLYPFANMASLEYPPIEGRLLGWMTHLYRSDGLLFWHVNYWHGNPNLDEGDTYFPEWHTYSGLHMPGDGIFLYPGKEHVLSSIRLAQVRDGVEDYERLQLAAAKAGAAKTDAFSRELITDMKNYTRNPAALREVRSRLGDLIEGR